MKEDIKELIHFMKAVENPLWMIELVERMQWNLCNDKPPTEDGEYFVTTESGERKVDEWHHGEWKYYDVKAWMYLPEPCLLTE